MMSSNFLYIYDVHRKKNLVNYLHTDSLIDLRILNLERYKMTIAVYKILQEIFGNLKWDRNLDQFSVKMIKIIFALI